MPDHKQLVEELRGLAYQRDEDDTIVNEHDFVREAADTIERLEEERDLAIAHDRQPYPTAQAYERVCAARSKWQDRAESLEQQRERDAAVLEEAIYMAHCHVCEFAESNSATAEYPSVCRNCGSTDLTRYVQFKPKDFAALQHAYELSKCDEDHTQPHTNGLG